jgi:hypothetical protein
MEESKCKIDIIDINIIKEMYEKNDYKNIKHINGITLQLKRQYVKEIYCKNQLVELQCKIDSFNTERIKTIYNSNNYACLKNYCECSKQIKQELIKIKMDGILEEEHKEQFKKCLEYYGIDETMIDYVKLNGYNIFDDNFLSNVDFTIMMDEHNFGHVINVMVKHGKNDDDIKKIIKANKQDMYIFKNLRKCYEKNHEKLKLNTYPLLLESEKEMVVTINYYNYQKNRINEKLLNFNQDIYNEIIKYSNKPSIYQNMSLVCKMFYKIAITKKMSLSKGQVCKTCNSPIFERTLLVQCDKCNPIAHLNCGNIIFKSMDNMIDCIPLIIQHFKPIDYIKLGFVCKSIYNIVKTFVIPQKPIIKPCKNNRAKCMLCRK